MSKFFGRLKVNKDIFNIRVTNSSMSVTGRMFLSHKSSFFFLAKFDDHIYPFAWYNGPKQLSQGKKGLYGTLSDPSTSSDPDALSDAKSAPRIAPKVILAHVGLFLLNNADLECGASKLKTGL